MRPAFRYAATLDLYKEQKKETKTHTVGGRMAWSQIEKHRNDEMEIVTARFHQLVMRSTFRHSAALHLK